MTAALSNEPLILKSGHVDVEFFVDEWTRVLKELLLDVFIFSHAGFLIAKAVSAAPSQTQVLGPDVLSGRGGTSKNLRVPSSFFSFSCFFVFISNGLQPKSDGLKPNELVCSSDRGPKLNRSLEAGRWGAGA